MDTPELSDISKSRAELKELVEKRIDTLCRGCGLLVYGSMSYPILIEVITEVIEAKKDFYNKSGYTVSCQRRSTYCYK